MDREIAVKLWRQIGAGMPGGGATGILIEAFAVAVEVAEHERSAAEIDQLCAAIEHKDAALVGAAIEIHKLRALLKRYRDETPRGHQPHMIAHLVDEVVRPNVGVHRQAPALPT